MKKGGVLKATITAGTANDGAYEWNVPPTLPIGTDYKIKVSWLGNPAVINVWSAQFAVASPTLTMGQPDGSGTVEKGTLLPVRWGGPVGGSVKILLYQGTVLKTTITATAPNDGIFDKRSRGPAARDPGTSRSNSSKERSSSGCS